MATSAKSPYYTLQQLFDDLKKEDPATQAELVIATLYKFTFKDGTQYCSDVSMNDPWNVISLNGNTCISKTIKELITELEPYVKANPKAALLREGCPVT